MKLILEERKVTFLEAIKDFWKGYFDFKGRSKRSGYWWAVLFIYLIYIIIGLLAAMFFSNETSSFNYIGIALVGILLVFTLAVIVPGLMLSFRRWRDAGLSNNGILIYFLLLIAFGVISTFYEKFGNMMLSLCSIISFVLCVLPSNQLTTKSNNVILKFLFRQK